MTKSIPIFKRIVLLCACIVLFESLVVDSNATNYLSNWESHIVINGVDYGYNTDVAFWTKSPKVGYNKLDDSPSFSFFSGLLNGRDEWNEALDLSISVSASHPDPDIFYYGGTMDDINDLILFEEIFDGSGILGYTGCDVPGCQMFECEYQYLNGNTTYYFECYEQIAALGYVLSDNRTYSQYLKTCTHEMGHAMGWRGHATNNGWIMYQGSTSVTTLSQDEIDHLLQIYEDHLEDQLGE